jgi:cytochrome b561
VRSGEGAVASPLVAAHIASGAAIFLLALARLQIRLTRGAPPPPAAEHPALAWAAHATHWSLYALMLVIPLTGAVAWFRLNRTAASAHELLTTLLLVLVGLHIAAALFHQFVLRTNLLDRMRTPDDA